MTSPCTSVTRVNNNVGLDFASSDISLFLQNNESLVALKVFSEEKFERELRNLLQVKGVPHCLNITKAYKHPKKNGLFIIETEVAGTNLLEIRKKEQLLVIDQIRLVAKQCLEAINIIHKMNRVHCNIKPESVTLCDYSKVKLTRFGLLTEKGESTKSMGYFRFSPVEYLLKMPADYKYDLWSLGVTLFFAYTDREITSFSNLLSVGRDSDYYFQKYKEKLKEFGFNDYELMNRVFEEYRRELKDLGFKGSEDFIITIFVSLHEFERAFGAIPQEIIKSICECSHNKSDHSAEERYRLSLFLFDRPDDDKDSDGIYKLRDLPFSIPISLPWEDESPTTWEESIRKTAISHGENIRDGEYLIKFIKLLCSHKPKSAEELLDDSFLSNVFNFRLNFNKKAELIEKYLNKGFKLQITDISDPTNSLEIDLNRSIESIENDCFHLLKGPEFLARIVAGKSVSQQLKVEINGRVLTINPV